VERLASIRFDRVLEDRERDELTRVLRSSGVEAGPWSSPSGSGRTYAALRFAQTAAPDLLEPAARAALEAAGGSLREPALALLEVAPQQAERLDALAAALAGPGGPAGIVECLRLRGSLLVELDEAVTPLSMLVDLIDIELAHAPGRRIVPLLGLSDERLAAFAAAVLGEPELDATRLIETYTEALQPALER
jgi:hypothetical protein